MMVALERAIAQKQGKLEVPDWFLKPYFQIPPLDFACALLHLAALEYFIAPSAKSYLIRNL